MQIFIRNMLLANLQTPFLIPQILLSGEVGSRHARRDFTVAFSYMLGDQWIVTMASMRRPLPVRVFPEDFVLATKPPNAP